MTITQLTFDEMFEPHLELDDFEVHCDACREGFPVDSTGLCRDCAYELHLDRLADRYERKY